jgi:hypothetical protein
MTPRKRARWARWGWTATSLALAGASSASAGERSVQSSKLWGDHGELWSPASRLPDFSHAGYRDGEASPPEVPIAANVADFGAVGDGLTDDTAAFLAALDTLTEGTLLVPAGRYLLTQPIPLTKSGVVLRGEGSGANGTTLYFPVSLTDLLGPSPSWSWYGGLVTVGPSAPSVTPLAPIEAPAARGDNELVLPLGVAVAPGDVLLVRLVDDGSGSLGRELHAGQADAGDCAYQVPYRLDLVVRVAAAASEPDATRVTLTQPLRVPLDLAWSPEVASFSFVREVGVEHLAIEFVETPYAGHLNEPGYNALFFHDGVVDAWARDLVIRHADNGLLTDSRVAHVSMLDIRLEGREGHHGTNFATAADLLVERFHTEAEWVHGVTVDHRTHGVVFSRLSSPHELALDHHRDAPFENLFTEVSAYNFQSGGNLCAGPHAGARHTYWNLAAPMVAPLAWSATQTHAVGDLSVGELLTEDETWFEHLPLVDPPNLYDAQLAARLCPLSDPAPCQRFAYRPSTGACEPVPKSGPECVGGSGGAGGSGGSASGGAGGAGGAAGEGGGGGAGSASACSLTPGPSRAWEPGFAAAALALVARRRRRAGA